MSAASAGMGATREQVQLAGGDQFHRSRVLSGLQSSVMAVMGSSSTLPPVKHGPVTEPGATLVPGGR